MDSNRVYLFDTTLRDGEQSPGVSLNAQEKLEIAQQLAKLGVDVIEAGFPITSPGDFEACQLISRLVKGPTIAALARANKADIDRAWEAVKKAEKSRIHTFIATSDLHLKHKLQMSREQVLEAAVNAVKLAKSYTTDVEFSCEDASRSNMEYMCQVLTSVIDAGANVVNIPDTVGYATPDEFGEFIAEIRRRVPNIDQAVISVHCHDDLGLAVANSLAAVVNGARQVECAVNGIGERAGNASLEEIIMALYTRRPFYKKDMNITYNEIYRTSRLVSRHTGMPVQPNKAIVGKNAFAHESGIHQDGVLKERTTYEIMNPTLVGINQNGIVLGKHSGRHALRERLEQLGFMLDESELDKTFKRFKALADKKKEISNQDLEAIVKEEIRNIPEKYRLDSLHISSGTRIIPTATIGLYIDDELIEEAACGDGPVDAAFKAVDKLTPFSTTLIEYSLSAITGGKDALGEVTVRIQYGDRNYIGRGVSTDIIEASVKGYINALNKVAYDQAKTPAGLE